MDPNVGLTIREAQKRFFSENGFPINGGYSARRWVPIKFGQLKFYLPNFKWRQQAIPYHDLHHILTGYACTLTGEMQIATWEFAAGHFPNCFATAFCLPLVGLGAVVVPKQTFAAFVRGRKSHTLYSVTITDDLLNMPVETMRQKLLPSIQPIASLQDKLAYGCLVSKSFLLILALPALAFFLLCAS
ncbi:MAG: hypothetical protein V4525_02240 [Pseudomonadota bacterium]